MVDFTLTDEQQMFQRTAREFAVKELRPVADAIRRLDRGSGQTPWDLFRPVFRSAAHLGLTRLLIPEEYGGLGGSCLDNVLIMEELGAADLGLAASFLNVSITSPIIIIKGGDEAQRRRWLPEIAAADDYVLASASSEPNVAGADSFCPIPDPAIGLKTTARRDGDHYVLNGTKAGFSTNAGAARAYFVMARTNPDLPGFMASSMFYVPADTPGLTVGKKTELIGWRTAQHAEVFLDEVRIPVENRIGAEGANLALFFLETIPVLASGLAAAYVGMARASFEYAWQYAHERVSWGQPIVNHQAVQLKLADMLADIESARLMVWRLAAAAGTGDPYAAGVLSPAAKTHAVRVAIRCAERTVQILGGYGVAADYEAGKFLTDAWVGEACDGTHDMLRISMVNSLRMMRGTMPMGLRQPQVDGVPPPGGGPPPEFVPPQSGAAPGGALGRA